jgi:hypothetical protein
MAIPVPQFNVPALSPAGVLSGRQQQDSSIENAIAEGQRAYNQRQLQQQQLRTSLQMEGIRQAFTRNRDFERDIIEGRVTKVPEGGFGFPGTESLDRVSPPRGEGEYVRSRDLQPLTPFTEYGGRATREGTTVADVTDPGTGQINPVLAAGRTEGDRATALAAVAELERFMPERAAAMRAAIESDEFFSVAEQAQVMDATDPQILQNYTRLTRDIARMNQEDRATVARTRHEVGQGYQMMIDTGAGMQTRDLTLDEIDSYALQLSGFSNLMSDTHRQTFQSIESGERGTVVPRRSPIDIREDLLTTWQGAAVDGSPDFNFFSKWIEGHILDQRGNVVNEDVASSIREIGREPNLSGIMDWAKSSASAHYRAAFALERMGLVTRPIVEEQRDLGQEFPWGLGPVMRAYETLDPSFSTGEPVGDGGNIPGGQPTTASDAEKFFSSPEFGAARSSSLQHLQGMDVGTRTRFQQANMSDDPEEIEQSFLASARAYEEAGNQETADFFRERAEMVSRFPEQYLMARDSVLMPTLEYLNRNR